jgi:hypothetical protein
MNAVRALEILLSMKEAEVREMNRKIDKASEKVAKRTQNPGRPFQEPIRSWRSLNTPCLTCGRVHGGVRCPIGT